MSPEPFEAAVSHLWKGRSRHPVGHSTMRHALWAAAPPGDADRYLAFLESWLEPGRERDENVSISLIHSSQEKQTARALFLTLMAHLAETGETV